MVCRAGGGENRKSVCRRPVDDSDHSRVGLTLSAVSRNDKIARLHYYTQLGRSRAIKWQPIVLCWSFVVCATLIPKR